ncbi:hypothetical protein [Ktedonospora formicarum]|uniref:hypothetical protein n=1 Tax=Ktedonospora formicarum TaxID=2778364 RepID=UPI001C68F22D|nr:hypothetical protein [Ktedonospora formicarum]
MFFEDRFVCRAICPELSGQTVSLKEIVAARQAQRRRLRGEIVEREALVKRYVKEGMGARRFSLAEAESGRVQGQEEAGGQVSALQGEQKEGLPAPRRLKRYRHE